ncbi:SDR family NAD(P)-dependent oxidoreductase [Halobacillus litoralis]|uniref:3-oxoacyl-ACP reductase n=1 Tax=Halobacillus litoralis TaxID=45668 RepID=A0A410MFY5_9BACI|nr:SDR family NAD(P)-dependent oxidoreductase [Halobacillus litoralis]QAS53566.1 3-oxoacyl-ACP reductase [Halobacillus litoralis]
MTNVNEETVIVTGSTKGIGQSTAMALAKEGAAVIINGRKDAEVERVVEQIRQAGGRAAGVAACVTEEATGRRLVEAALANFGNVTGLINNAGVTKDRMAHRMELGDFQEVLDVHVTGAFIPAQAVIRHLRSQEKSGFILNMTSLAGLIGNVGQVNYSAAKAAILGMTWTLAKELESKSIQVNAIAPAALTDMTRPHIEKAQQQASSEEEAAYWNVGSAEQVAHFLIDFIKKREMNQTGETYAVNGEEIGYWHPPSYELL